MPNRECDESIKNSMNDIWLIPKCFKKMGNQQPSLE